MSTDPLHALSPLDGRYAPETRPLRNHFSEFAYLRTRVRIECEYLGALSQDARLFRPLSDAEAQILHSLAGDFSAADAQRVKEIEQTTRHDVKAIEYFLREKLAATSLADLVEWLHFGLTSEDVNQTAQALALRDSRDHIILPALDKLFAQLVTLVREYKSTPMLARTHGQPAVPTTLGKEFAVYLARLKTQRRILRAHRFDAKLTGAVGNFNALVSAAPGVDWLAFSEKFIRSLGLEPRLDTTQLMPFDNWLRYFDALRLTNGIWLDFSQDVWRYISDDYLVLRVVATEVGSSTMPQKVNPIDFENAEGNLGLANALFTHYSDKLARSRLQRDLSDSTVRRTFGVALGHTLLAYASLARGLERVQANEARLHDDLDAHWEVIAEGVQMILRAAGVGGAFEKLKELTRGKNLTRVEFERYVDELDVNDQAKTRLRALSPFTYIGLATGIAERVLSEESE